MKLTDIWSPLKACILVTRQCNLRCDYCGVVDYPSEEQELSGKEFEKVFEATKALQVGINIIFGGEPAIKPGIDHIIKYLNEHNLPYAFITNASLPFWKYEELELKQLSCSVDLIEGFDLQKHNEFKSQRGVSLLLEMRRRNSSIDLLANVGLSRFNLRRVPEMVRFFSDYNIWLIATPLHDDPDFGTCWRYRKTGVHPGRIKDEDRDALLKFCDEMIDLKSKGYLVHQFRPFFEYYLPKYGIGLDWHCSIPSHLTINPDGSLLCCIDWPGQRVSKYKVWDLLDPGILMQYKEDFVLDVKNCKGCCWDHIIESEHMIKEDPERGKRNFRHEI